MSQGVDPENGESLLLASLRSMLEGGSWGDREQLARLLQARAGAHLHCFRYLRIGDSDLQMEITADAVVPLLKVREASGSISLPYLFRELSRLLETRPWPVGRGQGRAGDRAPGAGSLQAGFLTELDDERLLLALDQLLRLRVRQELHRRWRARNPRHSRWLRNLKRAQSKHGSIQRGKVGWHWALWLQGERPPGRRIPRDEILRALEIHGSLGKPESVLASLEGLMNRWPDSYLLLGEVIGILIELEDCRLCHEIRRRVNLSGSEGPSAPDRIVFRHWLEGFRAALRDRAVVLMAADRDRDIRRGKSPTPPEAEEIIIQAVLKDLCPKEGPSWRATNLSSSLREMLPASCQDGDFPQLYEKARYLRCRLLQTARELLERSEEGWLAVTSPVETGSVNSGRDESEGGNQ